MDIPSNESALTILNNHPGSTSEYNVSEPVSQQLSLEPNDSRRLANLSGLIDQHLRQIEQRLGIEIRNRGNEFMLIGSSAGTSAAAELLRHLYAETASVQLTPNEVHLALQTSGIEALMEQLKTPFDTDADLDDSAETHPVLH